MQFDTRGLNVMVVDNDRAVLEMLQIRLEVAGYHTTTARTGPAALEVMRHSRPAALVMDLSIPEIDGFDILAALTPRGCKPPFPILIMGRKLGAEDIQRAVSLGARDCMAKPFSGADALERVARLLRRPTPTPAVRPTAYV